MKINYIATGSYELDDDFVREILELGEDADVSNLSQEDKNSIIDAENESGYELMQDALYEKGNTIKLEIV